jgi:hypothetical protein
MRGLCHVEGGTIIALRHRWRQQTETEQMVIEICGSLGLGPRCCFLFLLHYQILLDLDTRYPGLRETPTDWNSASESLSTSRATRERGRRGEGSMVSSRYERKGWWSIVEGQWGTKSIPDSVNLQYVLENQGEHLPEVQCRLSLQPCRSLSAHSEALRGCTLGTGAEKGCGTDRVDKGGWSIQTAWTGHTLI